MPFEVEWEPKGAYKRFHGFVTGAEVLQSVQRIAGDPRFDSLRYVINDFLAVEGYSVVALDVELVAANDFGAAHSNPNIRIAVVTGDEKIKALARLYASPPLEPYPTGIFPTLAEARSWIQGAPPLDRPKRGAGRPRPTGP